MSKPYDILIVREYTDSNGEVRNQYYRAGVAFENSKGGMNLEIVEGMTITGRALVMPRKDRAEDDGPHDA